MNIIVVALFSLPEYSALLFCLWNLHSSSTLWLFLFPSSGNIVSAKLFTRFYLSKVLRRLRFAVRPKMASFLSYLSLLPDASHWWLSNARVYFFLLQPFSCNYPFRFPSFSPPPSSFSFLLLLIILYLTPVSFLFLFLQLLQIYLFFAINILKIQIERRPSRVWFSLFSDSKQLLCLIFCCSLSLIPII